MVLRSGRGSLSISISLHCWHLQRLHIGLGMRLRRHRHRSHASPNSDVLNPPNPPNLPNTSQPSRHFPWHSLWTVHILRLREQFGCSTSARRKQSAKNDVHQLRRHANWRLTGRHREHQSHPGLRRKRRPIKSTSSFMADLVGGSTGSVV